MRNAAFAVTLMAVSVAFAAKTPSGVEIPDVPETRLELALEPGEGWWGAATVFGHKAPLALMTPEFSLDIRRHSFGNQTAPLLISTHGRYVWCDQGFRCDIKDGKLVFVSNGIEFKSGKSGDTLKSAYAFASKTFFPPSGKTPDILFVSAPQYNTWIELGLHQTQEKVLAYAHKILDNGFPPGILMIDDTWQIDYGTWEFDPRAFPDPKKMMDELHALGFKVILWTCPFVSMDSREFRHLEGKNGLLRDGLGRPAAIRWWDGVSAVLDFDKDVDRDWYRAQLQRLQDDFGIDGFKFDAGDTGYYDVADQRLPQLKAGEEGDLNRHCENWAKLGLDYPFNEYRACWKMGGQPLVQRLCDKGSDFGSVATLIPDMIGAGLLGHTFVCPDMIGGGALDSFWGGTFDREAFIRSAQVHALAPMMQFSAAPWRVLSKDDFEIIRKAVATRRKFAPRYVELAKACAKTGEPMLRSMDYQFPQCGYEKITDQFVMGDFLIVAPQVKKGAAERTVQIPAGVWRADDGSYVVGPREITVKTPLDRIPHFERAGNIAWPDGKKAAFYLSFDDGCSSQPKNVFPLLERYKIHGTFYVCPAWDSFKKDVSLWKTTNPYVHLGNHTMSHGGVKSMADLEREIADCNAAIAGFPATGKTVAFGIPGTETMQKLLPGITPAEVDALCARQHVAIRLPYHGYPVECKTIPEMEAYVDQVIAEGGVGHLDFHGIGGDWLDPGLEYFTALLKKLDANRDKIWLADYVTIREFLEEGSAK